MTDNEHTAALRQLCTQLRFRLACGRKPCRRAKRCTGDVQACFARHWPLVPEEMKVALRASILAAQAKLPAHRIRAEAASAVQRFTQSQEPQKAPSPPVPAPAQPPKSFARTQPAALARIRGL